MKFSTTIYRIFMAFFAVFTVSLILYACASQATLTGGKQDITPPRILKTKPENYVKNFNEKEIKIRFDEYFQLNAPNDNIILTPTIEKNPDFVIREKTLIIRFHESLKPNVTYTITMNEAVKDITEGNAMPSEQFVFSTGDYMDSCMISGVLKDAYTHQVMGKVMVFLYKENSDSVLMLQNPDYYMYTNSRGEFEFHNLPQQSYAIYALNDVNGNKLYDLPNESIAFSSTLISSFVIPTKMKDSIEVIDNQFIDSLKVELYLFTEEDTTLKYLRRNVVNDGNVNFIFSNKVTDFELIPIEDTLVLNYLWETNSSKDTVNLFFVNPVSQDINVAIKANGVIFDTLTLNPLAKKPGGQIRRISQDTARNKKNTLKSNLLYAGELNQQLMLEFEYPIVNNVDDSKCVCLELTKEKKQLVLIDINGNDSLVEVNVYDTIFPRCYFTDSIHRKWIIDYEWKYNRTYEIHCLDSVFVSSMGTHNDTLALQFKTKTPKDYGEIHLSYEIQEGNTYIAQLLNDKGEIIQEDIIQKNTNIHYVYLASGKYRVRLIEDENRNNKWDTGDYIRRIQAEKIYYFSKIIDLQANWTIEEVFSINP